MGWIRNVLIGLVVVIALVVGVGFFLPRVVEIEESEFIEAAPATVYALTNNLKRFHEEWSPFASYDPEMRVTFKGPDAGAGARMEWHSELRELGSGTMEITGAVSPGPGKSGEVHYALTFAGHGTADSYMRLEPQTVTEDGRQTTLARWGFTDDLGYNLIDRYAYLFMEGTIREDYRSGLRELKAVAESYPQGMTLTEGSASGNDYADAEGDDPLAEEDLSAERVILQPLTVVMLRTESEVDNEAIGSAMAAAYGKIVDFMYANGLEQSGPPLAVYHDFGAESTVFDAAIPVTGELPSDTGSPEGVHMGVVPGGPHLRVTHIGPYRTLSETYAQIAYHMDAENLVTGGNTWESYVSDPQLTPEEELVTQINIPIAEQ